ncbi:hypothetical protein SDC9_180602 [bioreactor metagenome]|uniref:Uncharacterized protein n=1 Tax=bioreactor metagenome TaxID=1076179 RepID=A0A645H505_9ZZZZ
MDELLGGMAVSLVFAPAEEALVKLLPPRYPDDIAEALTKLCGNSKSKIGIIRTRQCAARVLCCGRNMPGSFETAQTSITAEVKYRYGTILGVT